MPFADATNASGAHNQGPRYAQAIMVYAVTNTTLPLVGHLVVAKTSYAPSTPGDTNATTVATLKAIKAPAAGSFKHLGVCIGGSAPGKTPVKTGEIMVCQLGIATVIFAATTTAGHAVIVSTATAGRGKTAATPVLGKTWGFVLQTKTISSGTALVPIMVQCY